MSAAQGERPRVLYVLSGGRSGSTLLDCLLGAHPAVFSAGELQVLPHEVRENRAPCGCGRPVADCRFWGPLLPALPLELGPGGLAHFRERHNGGRVLRRAHLAELASGRVAARHSAPLAAYGAANARAFDAIAKRCEALAGVPPAWIVDASKDPYRLAWLAASGRVDLRVVHLVKDPRAFVHSMHRGGSRSAYRTARFAARWALENRLMARLVERAFPAEHVRLVRYEDLATRPEEVLGKLGAWLELADLAERARDFRSAESHAIAGNRMRWESGAIRLDERWRRELGPWRAGLVSLTTRATRARLGLG